MRDKCEAKVCTGDNENTLKKTVNGVARKGLPMQKKMYRENKEEGLNREMVSRG